jgi:hypothetical protein
MKVTPAEFDLDLLKAAPGNVRTAGLHFSDIATPLFKMLDPDRYDRPDDGTGPARMGMGLAFEELLEKALAERLAEGSGRPGELVEPEYGMIYSPDLLIFNSHTRLGEIKLTFLSSREWPTEPTNGFPPKAEKYVCQMMTYCRCLETPYARLYVLFVNGDYNRAGMSPQTRAWDVEFSKRELEDNWKMFTNFAKQRGIIK